MRKHQLYFPTIALMLLIVFDASQQYYYLTTFDILPEEISVSFLELFKNHLTRWVIWLFINIPFFLHVKAHFSSERNSLLNFKTVLILFLGLLVSLGFVSMHSVLQSDLTFTPSDLAESFIFFFYQKGLTFLMASICTSLLILNYTKELSIEVQKIEIKELQDLNDLLKESSKPKTAPHLYIKTGHKLSPIPLEEIIWIQSDNYCVRVHTKSKTYTLRQSLKVLQEKLADYQFVRIHRSAIINLSYLEQINYNSSMARLKNQSEVPLSKAGIKKLKREVIQN